MTLAAFDVPGITSNQAAAGSAVLALAVAVAALVVSYKNRGDSRRAADAGERSATAAEQSAADAKRSADAAEATAKLERAAQHDVYAPPRPASIATRLQQASHAGGSLFGEITVRRDYRMSATGRFRRGGEHRIKDRQLIRANVTELLHIETWAPDRKEADTVEIEFRFWPALPQDDADAWECPCGKAADDPAGHWRFVVPVEPYHSPTVRAVRLDPR